MASVRYLIGARSLVEIALGRRNAERAVFLTGRTSNRQQPSPRAALRQLIPFNRERCDQVMAYLARKHGDKWLTQRDIVKLHVMADVYHVLYYGKPVIGGPLRRWEGGAVVKECYNRVRYWGHLWDKDKTQPENYKIQGKQNKKFFYSPTMHVDESDFSPTELWAMDQAWACVMDCDYKESDKFFHSKDTFMGRAWNKAATEGHPIRWEDIVDAYADLNPSYKLREHIKVLVSF